MSDGKLPAGYTPVSPDSNFSKMSERLTGIDFSPPRFNLGNSIEQIEAINASMQAAKEERWRREEAEESFWEESVKILKGIENNTANLYALVDLISKSNEQQEELIAIITDVYSIAKAKTQEEAKSSFGKVMEKISQTVKDAETIGKIASFAVTVWNLAQPIIATLPS